MIVAMKIVARVKKILATIFCVFVYIFWRRNDETD